MDKLAEILKALDGIIINLDTEANKVNIYSPEDHYLICRIDLNTRQYTTEKSDNFEDIFRILNWFSYKNIESCFHNTQNCNELGCENCSGCAFNSLSSFYKAKMKLNEYISSEITENYTFIGSLTTSELPFAPSPFKTYIQYCTKGFKFLKVANTNINLEKLSLNSTYYDNIETQLYIDQLIPEVLGLNKFNYILYGIYNNKAVVWKYINISGRCKWTYEEL